MTNPSLCHCQNLRSWAARSRQNLSFGKRDQSQRGDRFALGVLDRYSGWIDCFPAATKDAESVKAAMQEFLRSDDKVENCWTDNAPELAQAARESDYRHHRSADNRPQSNGVAERAMRRILEGTRSTLHRSGMDHAYWHLAMRCFCANSNFTDPWGRWHTHLMSLDSTRENSKIRSSLLARKSITCPPRLQKLSFRERRAHEC